MGHIVIIDESQKLILDKTERKKDKVPYEGERKNIKFLQQAEV